MEHCWTREDRLYLLNSSSNLLIIVYFQFSLLIVMLCKRTNDVVFSFIWTGPRYTLSKLSDSAAIQWINNYILLCNAMITITLVEWNSECVSSAYPTFARVGPELCSSRKISILPPWKGLKIPQIPQCVGGGGRGEEGGCKEKSLLWGRYG